MILCARKHETLWRRATASFGASGRSNSKCKVKRARIDERRKKQKNKRVEADVATGDDLRVWLTNEGKVPHIHALIHTAGDAAGRQDGREGMNAGEGELVGRVRSRKVNEHTNDGDGDGGGRCKQWMKEWNKVGEDG